MTTTEKKDYYDILGVARDANEPTIKQEYRNLALKYHPDRNPGDKQCEAKMKELNEAYAILSNTEKRRLYDTYGHAGLQGFTTEDIFRGTDFNSILEDLFGGGIFGDLFGRRGARGNRGTRQPHRGADLRYDLRVTLEEVYCGVEKQIEFSTEEICESCKGIGASEGKLKECEVCHGTGQKVTEQRSGFGIFRQITTCSACRGKGRIPIESCKECGGKGIREKARQITIHIPPGADTAYKIRIEGEGASGRNGASPGDLYVVLQIESHPLFERRGDDVYVMKEIDSIQMALGGEVSDIPGLGGKLSLNIPEGTQTGEVFRIAGAGMPRLYNSGKGDEYVMVQIVTPTNLSKEERDLLSQVQKLREARILKTGNH